MGAFRKFRHHLTISICIGLVALLPVSSQAQNSPEVPQPKTPPDSTAETKPADTNAAPAPTEAPQASDGSEWANPSGSAKPAVYMKVTDYGSTIRLVDSVVLITVIASGLIGLPQIGSLTSAGYYLGGPVVHLVHGNGSGALKSLGKRVLFPSLGALVGAGVGYAVCPTKHSNNEQNMAGLGCLLIGGAIGAVTGAVYATWSDAENAKVEDRIIQSAALIKTKDFVAIPNIGSTPEGGLSLGLVGSF